MAVKGTEAKERLMKKIIGAVPAEDYVGCVDKKYYFWSIEDGQKTQVCLTLTCPKTPVEVDGSNVFVAASMGMSRDNNRIDFEDMPAVPTAAKKVEITEEEKANIAKLLKELNL